MVTGCAPGFPPEAGAGKWKVIGITLNRVVNEGKKEDRSQ